MFHQHIVLPKKINVISEDAHKGIYEIEGLYPGYGHTLGNSLRRIILSSLPGVSIVAVKIKGADHEFATLNGVKEDVLTILLNLKRVRFAIHSDEAQTVTLKTKGPQKVNAGMFDVSGDVEIMTPDQHIAEITTNTDFEIELQLEKGIGFVSKEDFSREKTDIGEILVDAIFSPIRKVNYEVENMRVGDRTDYNLLRINLETDGSLTAKEALESALKIMINQFKAILDLKELETAQEEISEEAILGTAYNTDDDIVLVDDVINEDEKVELLKTRVDTLDFSARTEKALKNASIRTLGGVVQKTEANLLALDGFGQKSLDEVIETLATFKLTLKDNNK